MTFARMVALIRYVFSAIGMTPQEVAQRKYNSLRRFLPTVANVVRAREDVAQAIGSWEEVPRGEGARRARAVRPMSLHYSSEQALASGRAKMRVLQVFLRASQQSEDVRAILAGEPRVLAPGTLTWPMIAEAAAMEHEEKKVKKLKRKHHNAERF